MTACLIKNAITVPVGGNKANGSRLAEIYYGGDSILLPVRQLLRSIQSREPENKSHEVTPGCCPYPQSAPLARGTRHLKTYNHGLVK